jgi:hypothetical protein
MEQWTVTLALSYKTVNKKTSQLTCLEAYTR